ncbi:MAG: hypothetical protein ACREEV_20725, partial [Dongiaceae bacterium]
RPRVIPLTHATNSGPMRHPNVGRPRMKDRTSAQSALPNRCADIGGHATGEGIMGTQETEAAALRQVLQRLQQATAGRSASAAPRQSIEHRRQDLEYALEQAQRTYDTAADAHVYGHGNSSDRLRAREVAYARLREAQARIWPELQAIDKAEPSAARPVGRADTDVDSLRRQALIHLAIMDKNVQDAWLAVDAAFQQARTIASWVPEFENRKRLRNGQAVSANRSKIAFSSDYSQTLYKYQEAETYVSLVAAVLLGIAGLATTAVGGTKQALVAAAGYSQRLGQVAIPAHVAQILKNGAMRSELAWSVEGVRSLLIHVAWSNSMAKASAAAKAGLEGARMLFGNSGAADSPVKIAGRFGEVAELSEMDSQIEVAGRFQEELIAVSPDDIDALALGPVRHYVSTQLYIEAPVKAGATVKVMSAVESKIRSVSGCRDFERTLDMSARQECYFRVWEALLEIGRLVAIAALVEWEREVAARAEKARQLSEILYPVRRLAAEAGIYG